MKQIEREIEVQQKHYQELCFWECERLGMKDTPPYTHVCKGCDRIDWRKEWELIKRIDSETMRQVYENNI